MLFERVRWGSPDAHTLEAPERVTDASYAVSGTPLTERAVSRAGGI